MDADDIRALRQRFGLSQPQFADRFCLSIETLRQWERGRRSPDMAARVLLMVIAHSPDVVDDALRASAPASVR